MPTERHPSYKFKHQNKEIHLTPDHRCPLRALPNPLSRNADNNKILELQWVVNKRYGIPDITLLFDPMRTVVTCYSIWALLTRDPGLLQVICQGVRLDFHSIPPQDRATVFQPCLSTTQTATITNEIESLLCLKVIAPSYLNTCLWISPIFKTFNKDGTSRLILNLKKLNLLIAHIPFKMESIRDVIHMITQGVWMTSVDLHHAYYSVLVHSPHSPYFSFLWQGTYYHYLRLRFPNGYAQAPLIFTKLLRLPYGYLRSQGHLSVIYMDDFYLQGDSVSSCQNNIAATVSLHALGFNIKEKVDTHTHPILGVLLSFILIL